MTTALIADDEPNLATHLAHRLGEIWPALQIAAIVPNGVAAVSELARLRPDIAFLDIRMPGLSGLEVAQAAHDTRVVFVTAFEEYALRAFELAAVDYLLKPISDARLAQCVMRLQQAPRPNIDWNALSSLLKPATQQWLNWLTVGVGATTRLISVEEVLYFQSSDKYTEAVTAEGRHLIRTAIRELLDQLDPQRFAQIHRGTIVNVAAIERIESDLFGRRHVYLKRSSDVLTISRSFAKAFTRM